MSLPSGTTFSVVRARNSYACAAAATSLSRACVCALLAESSKRRMIAVSFKCRCQILRRLVKGMVLFFFFLLLLQSLAHSVFSNALAHAFAFTNMPVLTIYSQAAKSIDCSKLEFLISHSHHGHFVLPAVWSV